MDDAKVVNTAAAIQNMSATSGLAKNPSISVSLASLVTKAATLGAASANVASLEKQIKAAIALMGSARSACELELTTLKSLVENYATVDTDVTGMGFTLLNVVRASKVAPEAPAGLVVRTGKAHGKARVAVQGNGPLGVFVAQAAFDPLGATPAWFMLPGSGKQRELAYATGTKVWVQFAQVRWGLQGPWSTPVLVTMP